ncbi:MAG: hypothetical protein QXN57_03955 [Desulfurococcaceae archaeon]
MVNEHESALTKENVVEAIKNVVNNEVVRGRGKYVKSVYTGRKIEGVQGKVEPRLSALSDNKYVAK